MIDIELTIDGKKYTTKVEVEGDEAREARDEAHANAAAAKLIDLIEEISAMALQRVTIVRSGDSYRAETADEWYVVVGSRPFDVLNDLKRLILGKPIR